MTRLNPAFTSLKTLSITYRTPQETLLGTPETLPTSEPSTPQIGYTVQASDLPALDLLCYKRVFVAVVFGAGRFPTAGTLSLRMKKNGVNVYSTSISVSANNYYTIGAYFHGIAVGDLLELALWSSVSDSNWDYKAFQIQITRIIPIDKPRVLMPCTLADFTSQPVLTLGSPFFSGVNTTPYHCDISLPSINTTTEYKCLIPLDTYGLFRINYGDISNANTAAIRTASTYRPYYYRNNIPTKIKFRGLKID